RRLALRVGALVSGVVLVLSLGSAFLGRATLASSLGEVEKARSQVDNVIARRAEVRARLADAKDVDANDKNVELPGADNRVAVEKRRYDEAATRYNKKAGGFPASVWVSLFGMPARVPLSRETSSW